LAKNRRPLDHAAIEDVLIEREVPPAAPCPAPLIVPVAPRREALFPPSLAFVNVVGSVLARLGHPLAKRIHEAQFNALRVLVDRLVPRFVAKVQAEVAEPGLRCLGLDQGLAYFISVENKMMNKLLVSLTLTFKSTQTASP